MLSLAGNSLRTLLNINWEEDIPYGQTTNILLAFEILTNAIWK